MVRWRIRASSVVPGAVAEAGAGVDDDAAGRAACALARAPTCCHHHLVAAFYVSREALAGALP